jgi:hypothetical protein
MRPAERAGPRERTSPRYINHSTKRTQTVSHFKIDMAYILTIVAIAVVIGAGLPPLLSSSSSSAEFQATTGPGADFFGWQCTVNPTDPLMAQIQGVVGQVWASLPLLGLWRLSLRRLNYEDCERASMRLWYQLFESRATSGRRYDTWR